MICTETTSCPNQSGRLIRRAKVTNEDGKLVLTNAYDQEEFIRSTDPNFRPVWTATGPDGCLYICDMYHGIIQESNWTKEGSFLRPQIQKYGLDKNINGGRIWRLVHDGSKRREKPHMLDEKPSELVKHLSDRNGWWRDTAQRLLILRGDKSVVPTLKALTASSENPLARLHALWTLEGLDSADKDFLITKLKDSDGRVREAAIRIAEPLIASNNPEMMEALKPLASDPSPQVVVQYCLSVQHARNPNAAAAVTEAVTASKAHPVVAEAVSLYAAALADRSADKKRLAAAD